MTRPFLALALALLLAPAAARPAPPPPVWPLDLPTRYLTSNFMERRPGRWHAGLDLKTDTVTGIPVRAVEDGSIRRVRAEAGAYGRAIYLEGESGKTYVYAHLERFADVVLERVEAERARHGRYRVRLTLPAGELTVRAGQVLGLSGQSGTAGPHLHFEVRDAEQRPLNPLDHGFAVRDSFPPRILAVTAHAVRPPAAGGPEAVRWQDDAGLAGALPPLAVTGPVAFSAAVVERSDVRDHRLEPGLLEVRLDGALVYRCRNERFAFGDNNQQRLEWCEVRGPDGEALLHEHWLHRRAGVALPGREGGLWYLGPEGAGLAPGEHVLEITAGDRAGNRAEVRVPLQVAPGAGATSRLAGWPAAHAALRPAPGVVLSPFFSLHPQADPAVRVLDPAHGDPVLARTVLWSQERAQAAPDAPAGALPWQGLFLAADWPLDGRLRVPVSVPGDSGGVWIFRRGRTRWLPADAVHRDAAGTWFALTRPGRYGAWRDGTPPAVTADTVEVARQAPSAVPGVTLPRWEVVPVGLDDGPAGTGLDAASVTVALDGVALIAEPDLPRRRILVTLPDATPPGDHVLDVGVADRAGNEGSGRVVVRCAAPGP